MSQVKLSIIFLFQEIFTSMHDLLNFFKKEKDYVDDLKAIVEKKLVSSAASANLKDYIASFDDVLGDQVSRWNNFKADVEEPACVRLCPIL